MGAHFLVTLATMLGSNLALLKTSESCACFLGSKCRVHTSPRMGPDEESIFFSFRLQWTEFIYFCSISSHQSWFSMRVGFILRCCILAFPPAPTYPKNNPNPGGHSIKLLFQEMLPSRKIPPASDSLFSYKRTLKLATCKWGFAPDIWELKTIAYLTTLKTQNTEEASATCHV